MLTSTLAAGSGSQTPARSGAVDAARLIATFDSLRPYSGLLLAVSGGPDSIALLWLAARWAAGLGGDAPRLHVATVDHGLRAESAAEAQAVARLAAEVGLSHAVLRWRGPYPARGIQARARAARYALLADEARRSGCDAIVTAHHADDQAETVLMRLARGSGLTGLAGMRSLTRLADGLALARPLLGCAKAHLVDLCQAEALAYVEDPSNADPAYLRARLRRQAKQLAELGLDAASLSRLASRMARADAALERAAAAHFEACRQDGGGSRLDLTSQREVEPEIALRVLRRAILAAGGREPIRLERLERLTEHLWSALREARPHAATLAGTRLRLLGTMLEVRPESPRRHGG